MVVDGSGPRNEDRWYADGHDVGHCSGASTSDHEIAGGVHGGHSFLVTNDSVPRTAGSVSIESPVSAMLVDESFTNHVQHREIPITR